ncbi:hypothetical protein DLAC_07123 [Tieghemostelium lacteum]|uniref:Type A von Willebrand factor domain-containing protein n=1 Tax=Tieghemostelium lacteum TaxID=361077 RepID=A0A151ZEF7_TIELA|nr:hypothetical protein DLAC_07123 [Tieghemostelium lacteum]|eukprot:KYQ92274.1 hypothetical protein DLAC_07123 [Tieghemostelium lacteum]
MSRQQQHHQYPYYNYYDNLGGDLRYGMKSTNFKLSKFSVVSDIRDSTLQSKYTQEYVNDSTSPIEAIYELPLPFTSTITDLVVIYKNETFNAKIKEKQKAQEKYDDSIASGGQGFMISREDNGVFKLSLGNIEPKTPITITFSIIGETHSHLDTIHYFIPHLAFPTYAFNLSIILNVNLTVGITSITSLFKEIAVQVEKTDDNRSVVKFENPQFGYLGNQQDFVIVIQPKTSHKMEVNVEENEKDQTLALGISYYPEFSNIEEWDINQKSEFIFVVDCSGSMSGSSIESAKSTLNLLMKSIPENSKFNIYRFGSSFKKLYNESQLYNNESLKEAISLISQTKADLGGTELLPPIKDIFNSPYDPQYPRQVFILTDGEIDEKKTFISYVRQESHVRIFTFGIGSGVDVGLVTGISAASRGQYELITDMKNMEKQVLKLLKKSMEPMISNIRLQWPEGISAKQAPTMIRPVYSQERMMLYSMVDLKNSPNLQQEIQLTILADGPKGDTLEFPITINRSNANKQSQNTHKLVGLMMINDLLDQEKRSKTTQNQDQVIQLSKQYNILSKYTSLLITKESNSVTTETMKPVSVNTVDVPSDEDQLDFLSEQLQRTSHIANQINKSVYQQGMLLDSLESHAELSSSSQYSSQPKPSVGIINSVKNFFSGSSVSTSSSSTKFKKSTNTSLKSKSVVQKDRDIDDCMDSYDDDEDLYSSNRYRSSSPTLSPTTTATSTITSTVPTPKPTPLSSKAITGSLMSIIDSQNANGSWSHSSSPIKITKESPVELNSNLDIWTTLIILATLMKQYSNEKDLWSLIAQKATKFIRQQLSKLSLIDSYDKFIQEATQSL